MSRCMWVFVMLGFVLPACSGDDKGKKPDTATNSPAVTKDQRTRCDVKGKRVVELDLNHDKQADVWKLYESKMDGGAKVEQLSCKEIDLNFDGRKDIWIHYDQAGNRRMEEMDLDFDGHIDLVTIRQKGKVARQDLDTNFDGKPDIWKYYEDGVLARLDRDSNADGKIDYWEYYEGGQLDRVGYDKDGDGRVDAWDRAAASAPAAAEPAAKK